MNRTGLAGGPRTARAVPGGRHLARARTTGTPGPRPRAPQRRAGPRRAPPPSRPRPRRPRRRDRRLPGRKAGQQRTRTPARHPRHLPSARHARNALPWVRPLRNRPARRPPMPRTGGRPRRASRRATARAVRITTVRRPRLSHRPTSLRTKPRPAGGARRRRARAAGGPPSPLGTRSCSVIRASPSNGGTRAVRRPSAVTGRIRSGTGSRPASRGGEFPVATEGQG